MHGILIQKCRNSRRWLKAGGSQDWLPHSQVHTRHSACRRPLGAGLALSSPSIVMLALAFLLTMHLFVVVYEEPSLAGKFGASYQQYKSSVHRWLIRKQKSRAKRDAG
jgi:hypothetical protein